MTDYDGDDLSEIFENGTSFTNPNDRFSAWPGMESDDEVYAGGHVEEAGINAADITKDWAAPGSQW